uniref:SXP/RAL-2 family protein Ani s 5-like cation-binding domain-containing protein n=1 Tax=Panagrolaimus sp. ES5 TaxID=591445 RepID=A0AC34G7M5_9BILA
MIKFTLFIFAASFISTSLAFWPFDGLNGGQKGGRFPPSFPDSGEFRGEEDFPRPPFPTFLKDVDQSERKEWFEIEHSKNSTKAEIQALKDQWAANQTAEVQQAYNEYKEAKLEFIANVTAKGDEFAANLTQDAQNIYNQIKEILQNQDITPAEECEQIKDTLSNTTKEVRRELKPLKKMVVKKCHQKHGGRPHGGPHSGSHEHGCGGPGSHGPPRRDSNSDESQNSGEFGGPRGPPRGGPNSGSNSNSDESGENRPHHPRPSGRPRPSGSPRPTGFTDIPLDGSTDGQFPTLPTYSTTSGGFFRNLFRF